MAQYVVGSSPVLYEHNQHNVVARTRLQNLASLKTPPPHRQLQPPSPAPLPFLVARPCGGRPVPIMRADRFLSEVPPQQKVPPTHRAARPLSSRTRSALPGRARSQLQSGQVRAGRQKNKKTKRQKKNSLFLHWHPPSPSPLSFPPFSPRLNCPSSSIALLRASLRSLPVPRLLDRENGDDDAEALRSGGDVRRSRREKN